MLPHDSVKVLKQREVFLLPPGNGGDVLGPLAGLLNRMWKLVRPIVTDPNVHPKHGWRHRFSTI